MAVPVRVYPCVPVFLCAACVLCARVTVLGVFSCRLVRLRVCVWMVTPGPRRFYCVPRAGTFRAASGTNGGPGRAR